MVSENIKSCGKGHQPQNAWEEVVVQNWNLNGLSLTQNGPNLRDLARWDFPSKDWYKINFYGASKGNSRIAYCGIIIRNMNGERVHGMSIPIGVQTNHVVEASAALYDLSHAKSLNLKNIWLEGDSINIINYLTKVTNPLWTINNIIGKATDLINSFKNCVFTHNYRETNQFVDWMANVACKSDEKLIWNQCDIIPIEGILLIEHDKARSKQNCLLMMNM